MNEQTLELVTAEKPQELMRRATDVAGICKEIVLKTACQIQGKKYVKCEGWMSIATAHGCIASSRDVHRVENGWTAVGEIRRISDGVLLAQAEGYVGKDEKRWGQADEYACRAMAQTRAISRACRAAFAHVVVLMDAGLSTTPFEEVPEGGFDHAKPAKTEVSAPVTPKPPQNTPTVTQRTPITVPVTPKEAPKAATEVTRGAMMEYLMEHGVSEQDICGYGIDKAIIMPNEGLADWPLDKVGVTKTAWNWLLSGVKQWRDGDLASPAPIQVPRDPPKTSDENDPPCFKIIVPVPHKGQKRDDYMKQPDTIGSLYYAMKSGDESAQSRLWGFANHFEPKGWTKKTGEQMPPSDADIKFRAALDEFIEWHKGENLIP